VLERGLRQTLGMAGQVNFAIATEYPAVAFEENRRVVMPDPARLAGQLRIAEAEPYLQFPCQVEQWPGLGARYFALEKPVDLGLVGHPPAREEGGERQFRKDDKGGTPAMRLAQQCHEPGDDRGTAVGEMNGPELGDSGGQSACHRGLPPGPKRRV